MSRRRIVTVHANTYLPDTRLQCDNWLEAHAVAWWFGRKRGRTITIQRDPNPVTRWWWQCEKRMTNRFNQIGN